MASRPHWLGDPLRGKSSAGEIFTHDLHIFYLTGLLLSKWMRQTPNAGVRCRNPLVQRGLSHGGYGGERQQQQPLVKPTGRDHGCQAPHSLDRLTRKGTKLFVSISVISRFLAWPDDSFRLTLRPEQTRGPTLYPGGPEPGLGQAVLSHR